MASDVAKKMTPAVADTVMALYEELAEVTAAFLEAVADEVPDEAAQALFWAARTDLVERLQPLLVRQKRLSEYGDGPVQQDIAVQQQGGARLANLDAQVLSRLAALRAKVGMEIKALSQGKKGLVGYRVGLKGAPRFCRMTV
jgi:hypothetical protein